MFLFFGDCLKKKKGKNPQKSAVSKLFFFHILVTFDDFAWSHFGAFFVGNGTFVSPPSEHEELYIVYNCSLARTVLHE